MSSMEWQEERRKRAYELVQRGWSQKKVAEALGVTEGAVSQWMKRAREGGAEALRHRPAPGAASKLSAEQWAKLPTMLARGAEAYGYSGGVWTRARVRQVIEDVFGVKYHVDHMSYVLKKIGWSSQKPIRRATQRNEAKIQEWQEHWQSTEKKRGGKDKR
jgi:transposase